MGQWHHSIVEKIPTFPACKFSFYRQCNSKLQQQPATLQNINLQGEWTETFVNLRHLSQADTIFAVWTFYASAVLFNQLYTIHALIDGEMYPYIFALLPDKRQTTYQRLFDLLKAAGTNNTPIAPTTFFMDFKSAELNVAETVFPTATVKGCLFHFCQRIW